MAGVVLENVSRVYPGGVAAVKEVTLTVEDQEFLVLVGPSGCGKSTTLRMIAGLEELTSGKIAIGTRVVNDVPPNDRDIAMVFQNYALYPHLSVYGNLAFGLELRERTSGFGVLWRSALSRQRRAELAARRLTVATRVRWAASVLGIDDLLERYPRQLSGGQRQRVALGRAIVRNPAVYLFDEPLSNLDAKLRGDMRRELKRLHHRLQTTIVYVTHDQVEAMTLGQRIVVMNEGMIQQIGRPMEVYGWPRNRFVAEFIGTPGMNFIPGELIGEQTALEFRRDNWSISLAERRIHPSAAQATLPGSKRSAKSARAAVLGVRPEDVCIEKPPREVAGSLRAEVRSLDLLGDSAIASLEINDGYDQHKNEVLSVLTKIEPRGDLRPGDQVSLRVDIGRVHLFDPQTGDNWVARPMAIDG